MSSCCDVCVEAALFGLETVSWGDWCADLVLRFVVLLLSVLDMCSLMELSLDAIVSKPQFCHFSVYFYVVYVLQVGDFSGK